MTLSAQMEDGVWLSGSDDDPLLEILLPAAEALRAMLDEFDHRFGELTSAEWAQRFNQERDRQLQAEAAQTREEAGQP